LSDSPDIGAGHHLQAVWENDILALIGCIFRHDFSTCFELRLHIDADQNVSRILQEKRPLTGAETEKQKIFHAAEGNFCEFDCTTFF